MTLPRLRRADLISLALIAIPVLVTGGQGWRQRWNTDDAFINFRVVDNLLAGNGPVFNAGERVESATSPLWAAILAAIHGITGLGMPWTAVLLGLALSATGVAAGSLGALLLWRALGRDGVALPLGAGVFASVPAAWDFYTSGLETGLSFAWLGVSFLALADLYARDVGTIPERRRPGPAAVAVIAGLGPLIRPDLGVFSVAFLAALLVVRAGDSRGRRLALVASAAALPLAFELFRMGYYAALVPTPALAKEAGTAFWSRGWDYLVDLFDPYVLWLPLAALAALAAFQARGARGGRAGAAVALAPLAGGLVHGLFVVRVGGDFMHGRLLLPSLFGVLLPVMTVPLNRWRVAVPIAAVVAGWCVVCTADLRRPLSPDPFVQGRFAEERRFYVEFAHEYHPITLEDYGDTSWALLGGQLHALAGHRRYLVLRPSAQRFARGDPEWPEEMRSRPGLENDVVGALLTVGLVGYAAGPDVTIVDRLGLGDPIAARLALPDKRPFKAGHEKELHLAWVVARFGDLTRPPGTGLAREPSVRAAQRALRCGDVKRVLNAVDDPLTPGRFLANLPDAFRLHGVRFETDPVAVAREECG